MEKRKPDTRKHRQEKGGIDGAIERLKESPIAYNLVSIVLILVAIIAACSLLMMILTRHGTHRTVPDLTGITLSDAERVARDKGLKIIINDSLYVPTYDGGIVLDQLPVAGSQGLRYDQLVPSEEREGPLRRGPQPASGEEHA